ncbi:MAG: hypothetical protein FWE06_04050 [Oscillospiraceae bacterium]|nr:hypothetical protein [Oscillospiraceae bacterium]
MYLDPGFGGMLLQVIIAIVAVGGGLLFAFRRKIRGLFSRDKNAGNTPQNDVQEDAVDMLDDE